MLPYFFTSISFFFTLVVHPSSASWPRDIRVALFKSLKILVFCAGRDRCFDNGMYPTLLSLIVVEFGSFTGEPSSFWISCNASVSSSLQKWLDAPLSDFAIHTILCVFTFWWVYSLCNIYKWIYIINVTFSAPYESF